MATPQTSATWGTVIPYSTQTRMRGICDGGISTVACCFGLLAGAVRSFERPGAGDAMVANTRGLRTAVSVGGEASRFGRKSASASVRVLAICRRSSPRESCCRDLVLSMIYSVHNPFRDLHWLFLRACRSFWLASALVVLSREEARVFETRWT